VLIFASIMQKSYNTSMTNQQHVLIWYLISHNYQHVSSTSSIYITPHMSKSSTYINITLTVLTALHILVTSVNSVDIWQIKFHAHYRELYVQNTSRNKKFRKSVSYISYCIDVIDVEINYHFLCVVFSFKM